MVHYCRGRSALAVNTLTAPLSSISKPVSLWVKSDRNQKKKFEVEFQDGGQPVQIKHVNTELKLNSIFEFNSRSTAYETPMQNYFKSTWKKGSRMSKNMKKDIAQGNKQAEWRSWNQAQHIARNMELEEVYGRALWATRPKDDRWGEEACDSPRWQISN